MQKVHMKQYLINKCEKMGLNRYENPKAFVGYSNDMQDVYINIEEDSLGKKSKILTVFDDMIADMINNKNLNSIKTKSHIILFVLK